jgi:hypothetical protein
VGVVAPSAPYYDVPPLGYDSFGCFLHRSSGNTEWLGIRTRLCVITRHSAWRIGFDGVREMPEQREKTRDGRGSRSDINARKTRQAFCPPVISPLTRDLNAQKGPNLRFRPAFTTLMFEVTPTEVVAIPHTAVVQTKVLELLLLKL